MGGDAVSTDPAVTAPTNPALVQLPDPFLDGQLVHQWELNAMGWDVDALTQITQGAPVSKAPAGKPVAKIILSGSTSVPSGTGGTTQIISWGSAVKDTDGMFDPVTNNRLVVRTPGWYRLYASAMWDSAGTANSERVLQILVNGTSDPENVAASDNAVVAGAGEFWQQCVAHEPLQVGASIYVGVFQDTGSGLQLVKNGLQGTWLVATWDAPYS
jgi:hypothetical protein